ncbi:hypothetical protein HID58_066957, partial [Brassica napus]
MVKQELCSQGTKKAEIRLQEQEEKKIPMGQLVRIRSGEWMKKDDVGWRFHEDLFEVEHYIITRNNEDVHALMALVREELLLSPTTPIVLTYQLPETLQDATASHHHLIPFSRLNIIQEWRNEVKIYVTSGALRVARFQFLCRTPFTIGETTYLADGITEEQHLAFINTEVGDDEIKCNGRVLKEIFSEEKLLLIYRYSLDIEKAQTSIDLNISPTLPIGKNNIAIPDTQNNSIEVSISDEEIQRGSQSSQSKRLEVSRQIRGGSIAEEMSEDSTFFKSAWGEMEVGFHFWDTVGVDAGDDIINITSDYNMEDRIHNTDVLDIDGSSTGSTIGVGINYNFPRSCIYNHSGQHKDRHIYFVSGQSHENEIIPDLMESRTGLTSPTNHRTFHPNANLDSEIRTDQSHSNEPSVIEVTDSSSEARDSNGVAPHNPDVVYVGMVFNSREEFKQYMAIYAIRKKFRDDSGSQIEVNPPSTRRPPGRPKKSRILSRGEFQLRGTRKRT